MPLREILFLLVFLAQGSAGSEPVTHLLPNRTSIDPASGGTRLDLINAPVLLHLPKLCPKFDSQGNVWIIAVHNLGPHPVTVEGNLRFLVLIPVGGTVRIESTGVRYKLHY